MGSKEITALVTHTLLQSYKVQNIVQHIDITRIRPELKKCNSKILTLRPKRIPIAESMVNK